LWAFPLKVMKTATLYVFLSCDFAVTGLWNCARSLEKLTNGKRCIGNLSSVKFWCKLPSPYSIFGIQKPGMFSRPVGWGYDLDKQMKKQLLYCSSQSSPFKVWTIRKHTGKTPLNLGLLLNLFIKQILTLVWSTDFGNSQIQNCLHIAYAFEHSWSTNQSLFHSMNDILILKRCCKETWSSHSTKHTSAVHKTVLMTVSRGESKLRRSSKWFVSEHFISKMHKSEWGRVF
jgi:hypothetical protein